MSQHSSQRRPGERGDPFGAAYQQGDGVIALAREEFSQLQMSNSGARFAHNDVNVKQRRLTRSVIAMTPASSPLPPRSGGEGLGVGGGAAYT
jgi:hypothetical protein